MADTTARGRADHRMAHDMEVAMKWIRERHEARSPGKPFDRAAAEKWAEAATLELATRNASGGPAGLSSHVPTY